MSIKSFSYKHLVIGLSCTFVGGIFIMLARGIIYIYYGNQLTYFLNGMRLFDAAFIPKDWFTSEVFHHEFAFSILLYVLQLFGSLEIPVAIAQWVNFTILSLALFLLSKWFSKHPYIVFILCLGCLAVYKSLGIGLGWQRLINGYLQPAEIAGPLMVLGFALLFWRRLILSGLFFGLGGLFHMSYLVSFGPSIIATALAVGIWKNKKDLFSFGIPLGILWLVHVAIVGKAYFSAPDFDAKIWSIIFQFRNPGDFIFSNWPREQSYVWLMGAGTALAVFLFSKSGVKLSALKVSFFAALATIFIGIVAMQLDNVPSIKALMLWRVAPWVSIIGHLIGLDYLINLATGQLETSQKEKLVIITSLLIAFLWLIFHKFWGKPFKLIFTSAIPTCFLISWLISICIGWIREKKSSQLSRLRLGIAISTIAPFLVFTYLLLEYAKHSGFSPKHQVIWVCAISITFFGAFLWALVPIFFIPIVNHLKELSVNRSRIFFVLLMAYLVICLGYSASSGIRRLVKRGFHEPLPYQLVDLQNWIRTSTPNDSIFIVHPGIDMFTIRIKAKRAVVVDASPMPQLPKDFLEWYRRICDVTGYPSTIPPLHTAPVMIEGYHDLDTNRAQLLKDRYGANYVIVHSKKHRGDLNGLKERFNNDSYKVYEIF